MTNDFTLDNAYNYIKSFRDVDITLEGTVSQIPDLVPSFYFITKTRTNRKNLRHVCLDGNLMFMFVNVDCLGGVSYACTCTCI